MNVFFRTLFSALAACVLASSLAAKPVIPPKPKTPLPSGTLYFFNIQLDPRYQIVGVGPLTEQQAATANCYCFTYGARGKLQHVEFDRAGVPMSDPFFNAAKIDFEYSPGLERRWYRNGVGQTVANLNGVQGEELTLNSSGYPTQVTNRDDAGGAMRDNAGVMRVDRTLDNQNRVVRGCRTGLLGIYIRDNDGYFETRTVYDNQDRTVDYDNFDSSGQPLADDDGVASVRTSYAVLPAGNQVIESYFDTAGQPVEEKSTGIHERQSLYDPRGFLLSEACFDASGAPTVDLTSGIHENRYVYDERGNQVSEEYFGTDGQPRNQRVSGYARVIYHYDDKNRVSEKNFVGDDGMPQVIPSVGAAVIRQEYDNQGNIVRRQFFDGQGNPVNHTIYQVPAIRIQVKGDTTTVSLRDANDNPATNPINGYSSFSYKSYSDKPLTRHNLYYDQNGRSMSYFRITVIRPHIHALRLDRGMRRNAHYGIVAAGIGALIAMFLALRKASYTKRRKIYVPSPFERFLGWFSIFAIIEGGLRFFITVYWAWVGYQNGRLGPSVYIAEAIIVFFFIYRLPRMRVTMRVLNISRDDIHKLVRDYFAKAQLKPEYREGRELYRTYPFSVRVVYFASKAHAYLKMRYRHREGRDLMRGFAQYVRLQVGTMQAPERSRIIAFYYPCVAIAYFALAFLAFYTFFQMVKP